MQGLLIISYQVYNFLFKFFDFKKIFLKIKEQYLFKNNQTMKLITKLFIELVFKIREKIICL